MDTLMGGRGVSAIHVGGVGEVHMYAFWDHPEMAIVIYQGIRRYADRVGECTYVCILGSSQNGYSYQVIHRYSDRGDGRYIRMSTS